MVFKKLLGALGVGGPTVDTVLTTPVTQPGGTLQGHVDLVGGTQDVRITGITLTLVARVEHEHSEGESTGNSSFARFGVSAPLELAAGERRSIPFAVQLPYETPVTTVGGRQLPGMAIGVRTEVEIAGALDKGDADPLGIAPLPVQQRVIDAFSALGFRLRSADLEAGRIHGSAQSLPFYQEIEFAAAPQYAHLFQAVELTFVTTPHQVEVVLEFDRRRGSDVINRYHLDHSAAEQDLTGTVDGWLQQATAGHGHGGHGGHGDHHGGHGGGWGAVAAGAAVGVVGGFVLDEVVEEVVEDFFED